jgi:hypothetical protein
MKDKNNIDKVLSSNYKQKIVSRPQAKDFANWSEMAKEEINLRGGELLNEITKSELELKKGICVWVKWVVSVYLIFIAYILLLLVLNEGKLESSVVIALLTTTTINILGLPYMIIKSLFPEKRN